MRRVMLLVGLMAAGTAEAAQVSCAEVARMVETGIPTATIAETIKGYERTDAPEACVAGLPADVRSAFEGLAATDPALRVTAPVEATAVAAAPAEPADVVAQHKMSCGPLQGHYGKTEITHTTRGWLEAEEKRKAAAQLRAPGPQYAPNGTVMVMVTRSAISAADTEYITVVFIKDGVEKGREAGGGRYSVPNHSDAGWWDLESFRVPAGLAPPFEVHALDTLMDQRCSGIINADGTITRLK